MWIVSFTHLEGVPACPVQLSKPEFAALLFESVCKVKVPVLLTGQTQCYFQLMLYFAL